MTEPLKKKHSHSTTTYQVVATPLFPFPLLSAPRVVETAAAAQEQRQHNGEDNGQDASRAPRSGRRTNDSIRAISEKSKIAQEKARNR